MRHEIRSADIQPEGILLTFPLPGGIELHLWAQPQRRGAIVTDAAGESVVPISDPVEYLAALRATQPAAAP